MSRIFDALQRSEAERQGGDPAEMPASAADLLESVELAVQEALQRSEAEPQGGDLVEMPASVADQLQPAERTAWEFGSFQRLCPSPSPDGHMVCLTDPGSLGAEKMRLLGVRLRHLKQSRKLSKVLITSSLPEEGKSLIAGNLACMLARSSLYKTILLEGDLRRPTLARSLGVGHLSGLAECLQAKISLKDAIYRLEPPGFWFLPAGLPPHNSLELMQSGRLREILDQLATFFDWIIIDSPPLLPLADTTLWMRSADAVLMVVREGTTEKKQLKNAIQMLDPALLLGLVLNSCSNTDHKNYYQRYGSVPADADNTEAVRTEAH